MSLIFRIALAALVHAAFFSCYPDTGPNGKLYLIVSVLAWTGFLVALNAGLKFFRLLSGLLGLLFNLAFFSLMTAAIALTMPQKDRTTVLEKARAGRFPDLEGVKEGFKKLKGYYTGDERDKFDSEIQKAADKAYKAVVK
jgi:hypothetical protein